ncbi:hypothetical protein SFR_4817 [Streptomyces sp. FR-008]|nr:hypothetical protein SFR_4817 [Streptomyces sp. FR-008]
MVLDCLLADEAGGGYLLVAHPRGDQLHDLDLP